MNILLSAKAESWPVAGRFTISRGSRTHAEVIVVTLSQGAAQGRGEATPYARYGESAAKSLAELETAAMALRHGATPDDILAQLPPGATRNALDAAWWDLRCKQSGLRITELLGVAPLEPLITAYTISIDRPEVMETVARAHAFRPLLKIKTSGEAVVECVEAVRRGAPESRLIVDANEAWPLEDLAALLAAMARLGVEMVEQPLPAGHDEALATLRRPLPVFADESVHTADDLPALRDRYDGVNLKLDKTGGLTEGLRARARAQELGMEVMCGCMLGTSLAMAPAMVLAQGAAIVDLDAPLLLAEDRPEKITYQDSTMLPYPPSLWG